MGPSSSLRGACTTPLSFNMGRANQAHNLACILPLSRKKDGDREFCCLSLSFHLPCSGEGGGVNTFSAVSLELRKPSSISSGPFSLYFKHLWPIEHNEQHLLNFSLLFILFLVLIQTEFGAMFIPVFLPLWMVSECENLICIHDFMPPSLPS